VQTALAEASDVGVLKSGFTAIPNVFWDSGILLRLKPSELHLLLVLYRFTTGYLRSWTCLGETRLLELTGLSSTTFYEAKRSLCQLGYIEVVHRRGGRCEYRISEQLQALKPGDDLPAKNPKARILGVPSGQSDRYPSGQPESCKESKEKKDQHQAYEPTNHPSRSSSEPSGVRDDESSISCQDTSSACSSSRSSLTEQLRRLGVSEFMAHKLVRQQQPETIMQALARLKQVPLENPAGYLVSEILRGGYGQLKADKTAAVRIEQEKVQVLRRTAREREEQEREQSSSRVVGILQKFEQLPPEQQQRLHAETKLQAEREGFQRMPGWGQGHPLYRGLLSELVAAVLGEKLSTQLRE